MPETTTARPQHAPPIAPTSNIELETPVITQGDNASTSEQRFALSSQGERRQPVATEDDLRRRAYEIYLRRGDNPGNEVDDWLKAERELLAD